MKPNPDIGKESDEDQEKIDEREKKIIKKQVQLAANEVIIKRFMVDKKYFNDPRYKEGIIDMLTLFQDSIFEKLKETPNDAVFDNDGNLRADAVRAIAYQVIDGYSRYCFRLINFVDLAKNLDPIREKIGNIVLFEMDSITPEPPQGRIEK